MGNLPQFFTPNPASHFMEPGTIVFIPPWIMLLLLVLAITLLFPRLFTNKRYANKLISPLFLAFIVGSLMPAFDDFLAFVFGPPFAHHFVFHSLGGAALTYAIFLTFAGKGIAKYAFFGNLTHIVFNFYLDRVTLFFPFTYQEFGLADIIRVNTYWIKAVHYPIILVLFAWTVTRFFRTHRQPKR